MGKQRGAVSTVTFILIAVGCAGEPASIRLDGEMPARIYSLDPVSLPRAVALDAAGAELDVEVRVAASPPGRVHVRGNQLVPYATDDVVLTWSAGGATLSSPLEIRPIDAIRLRCSPECKARIGAEIRVHATAEAGDRALHELDVPLTLVGEGAALKDGVVTATRPGKVTVEAAIDETRASVTLEFYDKPDRVELMCKTVFTKTKTMDGEEFEVCHLTKDLTASVDTRAFSGDTELSNERVLLRVLDEKVVALVGHERITPLRTGRTILKATAESDPFVSAQIGLDVSLPRARQQLYNARVLGSRRTPGPLGLRGRDRYTIYYAPSCRSWKQFTSKAYVNLPDRDEPERLYCDGSQAVSCIAEASAALWMKGRMATTSMREWLGPCCCLSHADREELREKEQKR